MLKLANLMLHHDLICVVYKKSLLYIMEQFYLFFLKESN